jgi:hypothetical protein
LTGIITSIQFRSLPRLSNSRPCFFILFLYSWWFHPFLLPWRSRPNADISIGGPMPVPLSSKYGRSQYLYIVTNSSLSPDLSHRANNPSCISPDPANTVTERLNAALQSSGTGFVLSLCPGAQYMTQAPIVFTAPNQEISTPGYPTDGTRATLVVSGPVANGQGHTTAVDGTCGNCDGVKLRNIQVGIFV